MQVRPGAPARRPHQTDHLALAHALAFAHVHAAQVRVQGRVVAAVLDDDHVAVPVLPTRKVHHAIANGARRRARGCRIVNAQMRPPFLQQRMKPHLEATGDARKLQR